jgi:hypothetical protein
MSYHLIDAEVPGLPPRARVTVYNAGGVTHPSVVDEGLHTEISPAVDSDDNSRVVAFVRRPQGTDYVLRWDGGGETTVTGTPL